MNFLWRLALQEKKKTWWRLASRFCWNRARPWRASELVSFLIGLGTYQHPGTLFFINHYLVAREAKVTSLSLLWLSCFLCVHFLLYFVFFNWHLSSSFLPSLYPCLFRCSFLSYLCVILSFLYLCRSFPTFVILFFVPLLCTVHSSVHFAVFCFPSHVSLSSITTEHTAYPSNCSRAARRAPISHKQAVILPKLLAFLGSMCVSKWRSCCCGTNGLEKCSFDLLKPSNLRDVSRVS